MKFFYSTATCSTISHIALVEANLTFTPVEVSWQRKVHVEDLEKVSALGTVPTLLTGENKVLTQNTAILEYVADASPGSRLLPKHGTFGRLEALSWISFATSDLQRSLGLVLSAKKMTSSEPAQAEIKDYALKLTARYLAHLEKGLERKTFILGDDFSVADIALFTIVGWCKWCGIKTSDYKNVHAFMRRVYERPAVQTVLRAEGLLDYLPE